MGDLQKFIRQHFFDNNWTKIIDIQSLSPEKIRCIDSSFSHIDVKSKLCLLLAFSNTKPCGGPEIDKHIENIFLQALDEENNLVKAVATVLHSKQSLNYLNFDISPTNEAFGKNIEKLLKSADVWDTVETPLLAEYLGQNVLDMVMNKPSSSSFTTTTTTKEDNAQHDVGFRIRGKPESQTLKESYLEKLKDECQRRRVHVPIPGRSFARQTDVDETLTSDSSGFTGSSSGSANQDSAASKRKSTFPRVTGRSNDDSLNKPSTWVRPPPNRAVVNSMGDNRSQTLSERMARSTPATLRKTSGIKLLDLDELPAVGPKAKQLRKEKMEKERELKKLEREERAKEMKAAKEAEKLARQSARQALIEAKRQNVPVSWSQTMPSGKDGPDPIPAMRDIYSDGPPDLDYKNFTPITFSEPPAYDRCYPSTGIMATSQLNNLQVDPQPLQQRPSNRFMIPASTISVKPMIHHPLLSASAGLNPGSGVPDEEDDEDEDEDDVNFEDANAGVFRLGIAKNFAGFNSFARVSASDSYPSNVQSILVSSANPLMTSYANPTITTPTLITPYSSTNLPSNALQANGAVSGTLTLPPDTTHLNNSNPISIPQFRVISPMPPVMTKAPSMGTVKLLTTTTPNATATNSRQDVAPVRVIRIVDSQASNPAQNILVYSNTVQSQLGADSAMGQCTNSTDNAANTTVEYSNALESPNYANTFGSTNTMPQLMMSPPLNQFQETRLSSTIASTAAPTYRPRCLTTDSLVPIAPRPQRIIRVALPTQVADSSTVMRPQTIQPMGNSVQSQVRIQQQQSQMLPSQQQQQQQPISMQPPISVQQPQQQQQQQGLVSNQFGPTSSIALVRPANSSFMFDGRSIILTPVVNQTPQTSKYTIMSPRAPVQNTTTTSGFVQILPRPVNSTVRTATPSVTMTQTSNLNEQLHSTTNQTPMSSVPVDSYHAISVSLATSTCDLGQTTRSQPTFTLAQLKPEMLLPSEVNSIPTAPVKIQDLSLTKAQLNSVQNLFQFANRVSRPEKAMIVSFIAGARDNPHPETGNIVRIRLSEYRERVLNQATGQLMDVAADTFLHMDYSTGTYEKVKCYRTETPEALLRLPIQQAIQ